MQPTDKLARSYHGLAIHIARRYRADGQEQEDLIQEALIGLLEAARDHRPAAGPFRPFAALCMERKVQTAVRTANRRRARMLTDAIRVIGRDDDGELLLAVDSAVDRRADTPLLVGQWETLRACVDVVRDGLTATEREAFLRSVNGWGCCEKRLDNGLQQARRKLRRAA